MITPFIYMYITSSCCLVFQYKEGTSPPLLYNEQISENRFWGRTDS